MAQKPIAVITGATSGIGYELAKIFSRAGFNLVLINLNHERLQKVAVELEELGKIKTWQLVQDLANPKAAETIYQYLHDQAIVPDVLVNNAAIGVYGRFWQTSLPDELDLIQINITTIMQLTKLVLPDMIRRKSGRILNVASIAAFEPGGFLPTYYASKAFLVSFSEALAEQVRGTGVSVTVLCPGPTKTSFRERGFQGPVPSTKHWWQMEAATVAKVGYQSVMNRKVVAVVGFWNQLTVLLIRFVPRGLLRRLIRYGQERQEK